MPQCFTETGSRVELNPIYVLFYSCIFLVLPGLSCGMNASIEFLRRLGPDPHENGAQSVGCRGCPDIFELVGGDFAVIGIDITDQAKSKLPPTAGCGPDERIVFIPRNLLIEAKRDIPPM
jgi:hypothetical protein